MGSGGRPASSLRSVLSCRPRVNPVAAELPPCAVAAGLAAASCGGRIADGPFCQYESTGGLV